MHRRREEEDDGGGGDWRSAQWSIAGIVRNRPKVVSPGSEGAVPGGVS
jgi:hypothetical protein